MSVYFLGVISGVFGFIACYPDATTHWLARVVVAAIAIGSLVWALYLERE